MRNFNFIIRIAVLALLVSCNRFEPVDQPDAGCDFWQQGWQFGKAPLRRPFLPF